MSKIGFNAHQHIGHSETGRYHMYACGGQLSGICTL